MKPLSSHTASENVDRGVEQDHPEPGVRQSDSTVHQVYWDRDRDRRHHPGRQDEEQQVVLQRHAKPREAIGRQACRGATASTVEPNAMISELTKRGDVVGWSCDKPCCGRVRYGRRAPAGGPSVLMNSDVWARARREEIAIAFKRRLEQNFWADRRSRRPAT